MRHLAILCILLTCTLSIAVPRKPRCKAKPKVSANGSECMFFKLFMCDGGEWKALQYEEPYGSRQNPGYSCKAIKEDVAQATDGVYWIALSKLWEGQQSDVQAIYGKIEGRDFPLPSLGFQ